MFQMKRAVPETVGLFDKNENVVNGGKDFLLQMHFDIPDNGIKSLKELTSKDIYMIFYLFWESQVLVILRIMFFINLNFA